MPSPPTRRAACSFSRILVVFIGGALALFAWRAPLLKQGGLFAPISREGALVLNNLLLASGLRDGVRRHALSAGAGSADRRKISVGAPFFNATFGPLFVPLLLACRSGRCWPGSAAICWASRSALAAAFAVALVGVAAVFAIEGGGPVLAPFGIGLALFVMAGAVTDIVERTGICAVPLGTRARARRDCRARPGARRWRISARRLAARHHRRDAMGQPSASSTVKPGDRRSQSHSYD